jgi:hypothetical protein
MKKCLTTILLMLSAFLVFSQSDVAIGSYYQLNLQRQGSNADAFILHNAKVDANANFSWANTHSSFGSRGITMGYLNGITFYADGVATAAGQTFSPTARMFISNNGNVGIGTTSPNAKLDVLTNLSNGLALFETTVSTNSWISVKNNVAQLNAGIGSATSTNGFAYLWSSSGNLMIGNDGNPTMSINGMGNGNVGIGTTTPYAGSRLHIKAPGANPWGIVAEASAGDRIIGISHDGTNGVIATSYLSSAGYTPLQLSTSNLPRLTVAVAGNVGIGTTSPLSKLTIGSYTGTMTSTTGISLGYDHNSIEFLHSDYGNGYGAKLYGLDQGNGLTSFRLAVRGNSSTWTDALFVKAGDNGAGGGNLGYIGLGTSTPDARLTVKGQVHANEVKVDLNITGPDYVFEKDYQLTSLEDIKTYIDQNKHLPEVPSAKEMEKNGVQLGEMNMLLLKKIEELTLHSIEMNKKIEELRKIGEEQRTENSYLHAQVADLKNKIK